MFYNINTRIIFFSKERPKVMNNILDAIGMTPLVKLNHIPQSLGIKCQMCEFNEISDFFY